jgi:hypothetical protein
VRMRRRNGQFIVLGVRNGIQYDNTVFRSSSHRTILHRIALHGIAHRPLPTLTTNDYYTIRGVANLALHMDVTTA